MLKLLCVTGDCCPPKTGGDQAVFNAFKLLQDHVDLHVLVLSRNNYEQIVSKYGKALPKAQMGYFNPRKRDCYETVHQLTVRLKKFLQKAFHLQRQAKERELPLSVNLERNATMYAALNRYIADNKIDIVQFEFGSSLFWAEGITVPVKKVFVQHEIQYVVNRQRLPKGADEMEVMHWGIEKNREIAMMNAYDAIITLSGDDKKRLAADGVSVPIYASFAKVQLRDMPRMDYRTLESVVDLVFVGPELHIPNKHGMQWFLDNVWREVRLKHPCAKLHVIGHWTRKTISDWSGKYENICFDGFVDDLAEDMRGKIMIVPIFEGSGIRMKILEAANNGIPFVSCSVGVEGLGFENGVDCFITDDPVEFSERLNDLLSNPWLLQKLSDAAYAHVKESFSDEAFVSSRMRCYEDVCRLK